MMKMNLRDFSSQVCMLKRSSQKKSMINDKNVSVYFSLSKTFPSYPIATIARLPSSKAL